MIERGLIVSLQGYSADTTNEIAKEVINAGAIALRLDKDIDIDDIIKIGLVKKKVTDRRDEAYITPDVSYIDRIHSFGWADYIAVDYRVLNRNLPEISQYCREEGIKVVADIGCMADYENIVRHNYYYDYIATSMSVLRTKYNPDIMLIKDLKKAGCVNIIGEGNFSDREDVRTAFELIDNVCIGSAITGFYKQARKFVTTIKE